MLRDTKEQSVRVRKCHFECFDSEPFLDQTVIVHCTKRTQHKREIGQWRLLTRIFNLKIKVRIHHNKIKGILNSYQEVVTY